MRSRNDTRLARFYVLILVIILTAGLFAARGSDLSCTTLQTESPKSSILSLDQDFKDRCVYLERVTTGVERQLGLSGRQALEANHGMLFIYDRSARQCMWMKDMNFDLDMIWLDENERITRIESGLTPDTYPKSFCGEGKYVIELNAGTVRLAGLRVGDTVKL